MKQLKVILTIIICAVAGYFSYRYLSLSPIKPSLPQSPLAISYMRAQVYPGSDLKIESTLQDGSNYKRYIASYLSDGFKIFALLTVPKGDKPAGGWPVIIFDHGYIPPAQYKTTERYVAFTDAFSRSGYIVLKPDYRGNGSSEGVPGYPEYTPYYTIDILNAIASIKRYPPADSSRIGEWAHSMGGNIAFRSLVISHDIKAVSIWAGVVGSYQDLADYHNTRNASKYLSMSYSGESEGGKGGRAELVAQYGSISSNPEFWRSIDPLTYIKDITASVQLQHSKTDEEVPYALSEKLNTALLNAGKSVEFFSYDRDNHNFSNNLNLALKRSVAFFDKYLKN